MAPEDRPEIPSVLPWAEAPWRAFGELGAGRAYVTVGHLAPMGGAMLLAKPCPITWDAIQAWCDRARCDPLERELFIVPLVRALDREYLEHWNRTAGKPAPPPDDKLARWDALP